MDKDEAAAQLQSFEELFNAGFISAEEFQTRKQELEAALGFKPSGSSTVAAAPGSDDLTGNMKLRVDVFGGPFKNTTESVRFHFQNSAEATDAVRTTAGVTGDCVVATLVCKATADASELEILRSTLEALLKQAVAEAPELPLAEAQVKLSSHDGVQHMIIVASLSPDVSAIASSLIEAVARKVEFQVNFDSAAYAIHLRADLEASRNALELAQEMAGLPPAIAQLAQLYDCSESTLRFKSIRHLAGNQLIQEELPSAIQDAAGKLVAGEGFDAIIKFFLVTVLRELDMDDPGLTDQVKPYLGLGFSNIASIKCVQAVFGNTSLLTLDFNAPGFLGMCHKQFIATESN